MKTKHICFLFIIMPLMYIGCKKSSTDEAANNFTATIDSKNWSASLMPALYQSGIYTITGTSSTGEVLAVWFKGDTIGTYTLSVIPLKTDCGATYTPSVLTPSVTYAGTTGKVVVSKIDKTNKTISGTFEFTVVRNLTESKSIKNGQFKNVGFN